MKWASRISEQPSLETAVKTCAEGVLEELRGEAPDLAVAFVSTHHNSDYDWVPELVKRHLGPAFIFGSSAGGVIGGGREVERRPGFSLTVARLPGVEMTPFHLEEEDLPDMDASPDAWQEALGVSTDGKPHFLLLADPFTFSTSNLLQGLDYAFPGSVKVGGMASGDRTQGGNTLYLGDQTYVTGAVGLAL